MRRLVIVGALCASAMACTSVKLVQRDGCWMKHTDSTFAGSKEELGFCTRQQTEWAQDRLARLVQECLVQADYRWENRAIAAWSRGQPIPPQEADAETTKVCMAQATEALGLEAENKTLKARLAELGQDREALRGLAEKDRQFLQQNSEKMVNALGEAAKKPAPVATATATSTGTAKTESDQRSAAQPPPALTVVEAPPPTLPAGPVAAPSTSPATKPAPAPAKAKACVPRRSASPGQKSTAPSC